MDDAPATSRRTPGDDDDAWVANLHERLRLAIDGPIVFRQVADRIDMNAETVRRYMSVAAPSVKFLAAIAEAYDIDLHWLVTGEGGARRSESPRHALARVGVRDLCEELGRRLAANEAAAPAASSDGSLRGVAEIKRGGRGAAVARPSAGPAA